MMCFIVTVYRYIILFTPVDLSKYRLPASPASAWYPIWEFADYLPEPEQCNVGLRLVLGLCLSPYEYPVWICSTHLVNCTFDQMRCAADQFFKYAAVDELHNIWSIVQCTCNRVSVSVKIRIRVRARGVYL